MNNLSEIYKDKINEFSSDIDELVKKHKYFTGEVRLSDETVAKYFEYKHALSDLMKKLNEFCPLNKENISVHQYTEFDILEYYFEPHTLPRIRIKYKPKNVAVSFWTARFEDVKILN